jgi:hypothetical protein
LLAQLAVPIKDPLKDPVLYEDVNWFILEVNALKLEVVTKLLVSIVPPDPVSTVILNWEAFPLVKVIVFPTAEAVVRSEAVLALGKMTNEPVPS